MSNFRIFIRAFVFVYVCLAYCSNGFASSVPGRRLDFKPSNVPFNPTQIPNALVFWNYRDWPQGPVTTSVADEISGVLMKPWLGTVTNTGLGLYFNSTAGLSNATVDCPATFSMWAVVADLHADKGFGQIYGSQANNSTNIQLLNGTPVRLNARWDSATDTTLTTHAFGTFTGTLGLTNGPLWNDIIYSEGNVFVNGQSVSGSISAPAGHVPFQAMGNCLTGAGGLTGYIKYLLICTNHAITAAESSNLFVWETTNGISSVSSGLVSWHKLTEGSPATQISDSSGNGWTGFFHGSPAPVWTPGLNAVVANALTFDGTQNLICTPITSSFLSGATLSMTAWIRQTTSALTSGSSFLTICGSGQNGALIFSDGPFSTVGAVRGGVSPSTGGNFVETSNPWWADTNTFHFCAMSTDGTTANTTYWIDGIRILHQDYGGEGNINTGTVTTWSTGITNFEWGGMPIAVLLNGAFNGTNVACGLTDIRVYNRLLTDADIDNLYRAPAADLALGSYIY